MNSIEKFQLSVIIPTYNRSDLLSYTLQSLAQQTSRMNFLRSSFATMVPQMKRSW